MRFGTRKTQTAFNQLSNGSITPNVALSYDYPYAYAGGRPHAASQAGNHAFLYDLDGNQAGWNATGSYQNRRMTGAKGKRRSEHRRRSACLFLAQGKGAGGLRTIVENDHSPAFHGLHVKRIARAEPLPKPHRERHGRGPKPHEHCHGIAPADDAVHLDVGQKIGSAWHGGGHRLRLGSLRRRGCLYFGLGRFEENEQVPPGLTQCRAFELAKLRQDFRVQDFPVRVRGWQVCPGIEQQIGGGRKHHRDRVCRVSQPLAKALRHVPPSPVRKPNSAELFSK